MVEHGGERAEARGASDGLLHRRLELGGESREPEILSRLLVDAEDRPLVPFAIGPVLYGIVDEPGLFEGLGERHVVLGEARLDPARKRLHDRGGDGRHEPEIKEDDAPIISEHQIALVRVGVHEPGEHQAGGARLDRHARHLEPLRLGQLVQMLPLDPLRDKDLFGRVLGHHERHPDEAKE